MRVTMVLLLAGALLVQMPVQIPAQGPAPPMQASGTMSELMIDLIYPTSNYVFYIFREPPKNDVDWDVARTNAMTLAEAANLLMTSPRARDQDKWMKDAKLLLDVGITAYKAAKAKDLDAILALNDPLNTACVTCHQDYRGNYRRRTPTQTK
jgi:hypothetical protein